MLVAILMPLDAHAYLDPGVGSLVLQVILGAVAAAMVVCKMYWHRFLLFLGVRKEEVKEDKSMDAGQ